MVKRKQRKNINITLTIDEIKTEFEKQFNEKINSNDESEKKAKSILETNKSKICKHKITTGIIESVIKKL
jgi:metal-dependent hydrolase (beta-lactamase superfamily II)